MNVVRAEDDSKHTSSMSSGDDNRNLSSVTLTLPSPTSSVRGVSLSSSTVPQNTGHDRSPDDNGISSSSARVEDDNDNCGIIAAPDPMSGGVAAASTTDGAASSPAEIPPEPTGEAESREDEQQQSLHHQSESEDEDESEYEYEDEDDAAFSGFLVQHAPLATTVSRNSDEDNNNNSAGGSSPARIRDDESVNGAASVRVTKWREPSRAAVKMSLRAEDEKTGGKRRLAQDLYRIMNQDHEEAGFSIAPKSEDTMDNWIIKLFKFDKDSNLAKDMLVLGFESIELEMTFPDQYPFEPPFVRVVRPRFKRQTGFVMNGALCMELLTKDGWNPVNDIESVIVSIRSLLVVGDGRLQAAYDMADSKYLTRLKAAQEKENEDDQNDDLCRKRQRGSEQIARSTDDDSKRTRVAKEEAGSYTKAEAHAAYSHLSDYHKKKGWDSSGWWARKG